MTAWQLADCPHRVGSKCLHSCRSKYVRIRQFFQVSSRPHERLRAMLIPSFTAAPAKPPPEAQPPASTRRPATALLPNQSPPGGRSPLAAYSADCEAMLYTLVAALSLLLAPASAFAPPASLATVPRTAAVQRQVVMVAKSEEDKQLLAASKKVVLIAKRIPRRARTPDAPIRGRRAARTVRLSPTPRRRAQALAWLRARGRRHGSSRPSRAATPGQRAW